MLGEALIAEARLLSSASLHEAGGKIGALPSSLKPLTGQKICGRAFPVACPAGDNLHLHHAIYAAQPGDVLVVDTAGGVEFGYWGEIMAEAARVRGLAGLVITGGVRDRARLAEMGFPVFAQHACIRGTEKNPEARGAIGTPVRIGEIDIERGDLVFGDEDGIVVLPQAEAATIVAAAAQRDAEEVEILERLRAGETTLQIYGLPDLVDGGRPYDGSRRSIEAEGLGHGGLPIPTASRIGRFVATGGIRGVDPRTGTMPESVDEQAAAMFDNLRRVVEAAGGTPSDILKVTVWISDPEGRAALNGPWQELFPDAASRPARHVLIYDLPAGMRVQCDALVVIER